MCIRDRFYLVHLPGKLLLDTFPQSHIVRTDNIAKEINAFFYREYPFIRLYFQEMCIRDRYCSREAERTRRMATEAA